MSAPVLTDEIAWQIAGDKLPMKSGTGVDGLLEAVKERIETEDERTPDGYVPSGNIGIYFNRVVERWESDPEA